MIKLPDEKLHEIAMRAHATCLRIGGSHYNAAKMALEEVQRLNATVRPDNGNEGYVKAFYEIAAILGIPAQPNSPRHVFETAMKPKLEAIVAAQPVSDGWVKCINRLPEEIGRYWCYVEYQGSLGKSHYQWNCSWNGHTWSERDLIGRVTHWMPLPAAPGGQ